VLALTGCVAGTPAWQQTLDQHRPELQGRVVQGVELSCTPEDAEVLLDGVPQGRCQELEPPHALTVDEALHRLEVVKPGFSPYRAELLAGNARTRLTVRLSPLN
jgi:hypothetical protein